MSFCENGLFLKEEKDSKIERSREREGNRWKKREQTPVKGTSFGKLCLASTEADTKQHWEGWLSPVLFIRPLAALLLLLRLLSFIESPVNVYVLTLLFSLSLSLSPSPGVYVIKLTRTPETHAQKHLKTFGKWKQSEFLYWRQSAHFRQTLSLSFLDFHSIMFSTFFSQSVFVLHLSEAKREPNKKKKKKGKSERDGMNNKSIHNQNTTSLQGWKKQ